jgi:hypothetical protein
MRNERQQARKREAARRSLLAGIHADVLRMRGDRMTFQAIGDAYGRSAWWARNIWRRAAGVCLLCESDNVEGTAFCLPHLTETRRVSRENMATRRDARKAAGRCRRCGGDPVPGQSLCRRHQDYNHGYKKGLYDERCESGLCVRCSSPALPGVRHCEKHRMMHNDEQRAKRRGT